ncbi:MAG: hypothetical protein COB50_01190 [Thiotrichales bacterium]|nr:MAG: hypothetical protein COB50_01190 [Thiotrichales bacterium]
MSQQISIERNVSLSKSILWKLQRDYYAQKGIDAWTGSVPFYITSNVYIAEVYARVVVRFVQDLVRCGKYDSSEPVYVMELGTGSGQFSYYCMRKIFTLQEELGVEANICYVMTDFAESNIKFWEQHPKFQKYLANQQLDFAIYDLEESETLQLLHSGKILGSSPTKNPLCAFANYIFDTVRHDIFHADDNEVEEVLVRLKTDESNIQDGKPVELTGLKTSFKYREIEDDNYYDDKICNDILDFYAKNLKKSTTFLMPVGAFHCIRTLGKISNNNLMIISTDKGYSDLKTLDGLGDPHIAFHGSFSMSVNFHAIAEYIKRIGGEANLQSVREGIKTGVFYLGNKLDELAETKCAIADWVNGVGPGDFFHYHRLFREHDNIFNLKNFLSHMQLSKWDPYVFSLFSSKISEQISNENSAIKEGFIFGIKNILVDKIYQMPGVDDHFFNAAMVMHTLHQYKEAADYYKQSTACAKKDFAVLYNMGLCYHAAGDLEAALEIFKEAMSQKDSSEKTADWITQIEKEIADGKTAKDSKK